MSQFDDKLVFQGFPDGLDTISPKGIRGVGRAATLKNVFIDRVGRLRHMGEESALVPPASFDETIAFTRWSRYVPFPETLPGLIERFAFITISPTSSLQVHTFDEASNTFAPLGAIFTTNHRDVGLLSARGLLLAYGINQSIYVWDGVNAFAFGGIQPPGVAPNPFGVTGSGHTLDTTDLEPYRYIYWVESLSGLLSNPSPISATIAVTGGDIGKGVQLKFTSLPLLASDIRYIHVARLGGKSSLFRESLVFRPAIGAGTPGVVDGDVYDVDTGAYALDTKPDIELPDILPSYTNDVPPLGIRVAVLHQNRLFCAGIPLGITGDVYSPAYLWFSRPNLPTSFGYDDNGVDDDGGFLTMDDDHQNPILTLDSTGSVLVIGRAKSIYTLYGDGFRTFAFDKRASTGVAGRKAMCRCGNLVRYVGRDGRIYQVGDSGSISISDPVENLWEGIDADTLSKVVCVYATRRFYALLPDTTAFPSLVFDERISRWSSLDDPRYRASHAAYLPAVGGSSAQLLIARTFAAGKGVYRMEQAISGTPELVPVDIASDDLLFSPDGEQGRAMDLYVEGYVKQDTSQPLQITLTAGTVSYTYALSTSLPSIGPGILFRLSRLPRDLVGVSIRWRIFGQWYDGYIDRVSIGISHQRQVRVV